MMASRGSDADCAKTSAGQSSPLPNPHPYRTFQPPTLPQPTAPPLVYTHPPPRPKALQHQQPPLLAAGDRSIPVGYQSHQYPAMVDGIPMESPLPFCGIGVGWALFVAGFFFAAIPWYIGVFILLFVIQDHREKTGLIACTIAIFLSLVQSIITVKFKK